MVFEAPTYPASLVLAGRPCLVVGGGRVARRKVEGLLEAAAAVTVVAPAVIPEIEALAVKLERRPYEPGEAADYSLVIAATGVVDVDHLVADDARRARVLVNVADDPAACTIVLPAIARHGNVSVAVSTDGASPAFARWARDRLSATFGREFEVLAPLIARVRARVRGAGQSTEEHDWEALIAAVHEASRTEGGPPPEEVAHQWTERWLGKPNDASEA